MVGDEEQISSAVKDHLEPLGFHVSVVKDGQHGLETAVKTIPDLIVTDMMVPVMSGFELCKAIKASQDTKNIPIIVLLGKASMQDSFIYLGIKDFIAKPVVLASLENTIKERLKVTAFAKQQHTKILVHAVRSSVLLAAEELIRKDNRWTGLYARDAKELFAHAVSAVPDIILMDLFMNDIPADEMIRSLKHLGKLRHARIFTYYSGLSDNPDSIANQAKMIEVQYLKRTTMEAGATEYWGPFNADNFMGLILAAQKSGAGA